MCKNRTAATPRVYFVQPDDEEAPVYQVDRRGDDQYDHDHLDIVYAFFADGNTMDDIYRMCHTWEHYGSHDIVDGGLAEVEPIIPLKASPTTAIDNANRAA
jgi:hypothetical protein